MFQNCIDYNGWSDKGEFFSNAAVVTRNEFELLYLELYESQVCGYKNERKCIYTKKSCTVCTDSPHKNDPKIFL